MGSTSVQVKPVLGALDQLVIHGHTNEREKSIKELERNLLFLGKRRFFGLLLFLILLIKRGHVDVDLHFDGILIPFDYGVVLVSFFFIFFQFVFILLFDIFHIVFELSDLLFCNFFVSDV